MHELPPLEPSDPDDLTPRPGSPFPLVRFLLAVLSGALAGGLGFVVAILVPRQLRGQLGAGPPRELLGLGLFVGTAFAIGFWPGFVLAYGRRVGPGGPLLASLAALAALFLGEALLLVGRVEGIACLMMASPLLIPFALTGAWLGWRLGRVRPSFGAGLALVAPTLLFLHDARRPSEGDVLEVATRITIAAPPEAVWPHVVAFPPIAAEPDPVFAIVACPLEARAEGQGAGSRRSCIFTIGEFVERIEAWEPGRELTFVMVEQPAAFTRSLDAVRGRFRLTANPDGTTTLEGTTWYRLRIFPEAYWSLWTERLGRRIHVRVLEHIRELAEHPERPLEPAAPLPEWMSAVNQTCACTRHAD